ncbi:MAG: iron-sulfur cluster insertion protein ErpA, partial [Caulobacteraceae bacterium]|nr:iron-sulfur cluster insertion protein ErpA [Caulobacteraceae bacterium]
MIQITEKAFKQIHEIMVEEDTNEALRVFVQGGGCSGFQYGFTFDENQADDDFVIEQNGVRVLVDAASMTYLSGAEIDYKKDLTSAQFVIKNPNATNTCGCGSSFA